MKGRFIQWLILGQLLIYLRRRKVWIGASKYGKQVENFKYLQEILEQLSKPGIRNFLVKDAKYRKWFKIQVHKKLLDSIYQMPTKKRKSKKIKTRRLRKQECMASRVMREAYLKTGSCHLHWILCWEMELEEDSKVCTGFDNTKNPGNQNKSNFNGVGGNPGYCIDSRSSYSSPFQKMPHLPKCSKCPVETG